MAEVAQQEAPSSGQELVVAPQRKLEGVEKAAVLLFSLGDSYSAPVWEDLDDNEISELSIAMSRLGAVNVGEIQDILAEFISKMSLTGALMGTYSSTEQLLLQFLPADRVGHIMEGIRGPAGRNMWEKLSNVQPGVLANYLKNEYPQTVAVILSKINTDHAASVISILPDDFAIEVINRMLGMEAVQREILEKIEQTLRNEFISNLSQSHQHDAHELMAEIFNNFDRQTETRFVTRLEQENREAAERIKALMFTFTDLSKLDDSSVQTLLRNIEKDVLTLSMKGASDDVQEFFFKNMSERAGKMLKDDLEAMGPVRLSDVDTAQSQMVNLAKDLAAKGDIIINKGDGGGDDIIL